MQIRRILNNNAVVAGTIGNKDDFIALGKGIAYKKKRGDMLDDSKIEKLFTMTDRDLYEKFKNLMQRVDISVVKLAENVISYAIKKYPAKKFTEIIHITLLDHIGGVVDRMERDYVINNSIWTHVRRVYYEEFNIGLYAVKLMNSKFGYGLGNDEAAFIALHFVNAQPSAPANVEKVSHLISDIILLIKSYLNFEPDEENMNYYRFVEHVKIICFSVLSSQTKMDHDCGVYDFISSKYPEVSVYINKIDRMLELKYGKKMDKDDKAYLILYTAKLFLNNNNS